jgi:4-hydroxythreonine-4-phosphate dehydrogenase
MGDPAGIGPEIIVKALSNRRLFTWCRPVIFGEPALFERMARRLKRSLRSIPIIPIGWPVGSARTMPPPGRLSAAGGRLAARAIEEAVAWAQAGRIDAITTAPIHKVGLLRAGYPFEGHTEFLAALTGTKAVGMMMVGGGLRIMLATTHVAMTLLPRRLTPEKILSAIRLTHGAMAGWFGTPRAAIGVCGLNPHAGDDGRFGDEERRIIAPAIARARRLGIKATGPWPADTLVQRHRAGEFDAVVAIYHDQALIPVKLLAFGRAVNLTVGLPFVRTSVDHGTAYDIAGKGIADPGSLLEAIALASTLVIRGRCSAPPDNPHRRTHRS